jgi:putative transposase
MLIAAAVSLSVATYSAKSLQKFVSIHASVHNHFNQERHLRSRQIFKLNCSLALAEWRQIAA